MTGQKTLAAPARIEGQGLHLGKPVEVELRPAPENSGISFVRTDLPGEPRIEVVPRNLRVIPRRTVLVSGDAEVQTVEHLMAVLWALGIENLEVRIDGPELPGLDGSSLPYYRILKEAGIREQKAERRLLEIRKPIVLSNGDASLVALQGTSGLRVSYTLDYDSPVLGSQHLSIDLDEESFAREIAPARTFVLEEEALALRAAGFGKGASTENTLVLARDGRVIDNELRFEDEFVRHKILDLLGDLYLVNCDLRAHVVATKSGHSLNIELARSLGDLVAGRGSENGTRRQVRTRRETPRTETRSQASGGLPGLSAPLDIQAIQKLLPHRYPFLLVDRVLELEPDGSYAKGIKNVTANESYFRGHFPGNPVMPGVLVIEALAQLSGIVLWITERDAGRLAYLLSMDGVKFRRPVVPGDQLMLEARLKTRKNRSAEVEVRASVAEAVVAEAQIRFMLAPDAGRSG